MRQFLIIYTVRTAGTSTFRSLTVTAESAEIAERNFSVNNPRAKNVFARPV